MSIETRRAKDYNRDMDIKMVLQAASKCSLWLVLIFNIVYQPVAAESASLKARQNAAAQELQAEQSRTNPVVQNMPPGQHTRQLERNRKEQQLQDGLHFRQRQQRQLLEQRRRTQSPARPTTGAQRQQFQREHNAQQQDFRLRRRISP